MKSLKSKLQKDRIQDINKTVNNHLQKVLMKIMKMAPKNRKSIMSNHSRQFLIIRCIQLMTNLLATIQWFQVVGMKIHLIWIIQIQDLIVHKTFILITFRRYPHHIMPKRYLMSKLQKLMFQNIRSLNPQTLRLFYIHIKNFQSLMKLIRYQLHMNSDKWKKWNS